MQVMTSQIMKMRIWLKIMDLKTLVNMAQFSLVINTDLV